MHVGILLLVSSLGSIEWQHEGTRATFQIQSDQLSTSGMGQTPNWVHTKLDYEDFKLEFEYKLAQWAEAAVYLRAPRAGRPSHAGIAIVFAHDFHKQVTKHVTGAIAGVSPPARPQPESFEKWHRVSIAIQNDVLHAEIDGEAVQHVNIAEHPDLKHRLKRGFIGFPDLGYAYKIRGIKIEDLGGATQYSSLDGWKLRGAGNWSFSVDGVITGSNGHGVLYAQQRFRDFELTALVRSHQHVNGGIFLRGSPDETKPRGFEVQVYSPVEAVYPTGSVYSIARSTSRVEFEERWFLMQIRVEGGTCSVRLDGELATQTDRLEILDEGQIGLQIHSDNASVDFRDLRVRNLAQPVRR